MQGSATYDRLRDFVAKELLDDDSQELTADTPLLAWGIIDSMSLIRLAEFIENDLKVTVPPDELGDSRNLENLATITDLVTKYAAATKA